MKKFFAFLMVALLVCALPIVAFAEDASVEPVVEETTADKVVAYIKDQFEEISVIISLIVMAFYQVRKHHVLNHSIGTLNNNAVTVAESSNNAIQKALEEIGSMASVVNNYKAEIEKAIAEFRANAEEKVKLEQIVAEVETYLKSSKLANLELSNEVAELLVLANIPNAKKEELYSRHLAAVEAIAEAEHTEVKDHVEHKA